MKAKQRKIGGYVYRSILESKWGQFFELSGINFKYEFKGFETEDGYYLPDFYLSDYDVWIEIKPSITGGPKPEEIRKIQSVSNQTKSNSFLITGFPGLSKYYEGVEPDNCNIRMFRPNEMVGSNYPINLIFNYLTEDGKLFLIRDVLRCSHVSSSKHISEVLDIWMMNSGLTNRYKHHDKENNKPKNNTGWLKDYIDIALSLKSTNATAH